MLVGFFVVVWWDDCLISDSAFAFLTHLFLRDLRVRVSLHSDFIYKRIYRRGGGVEQELECYITNFVVNVHAHADICEPCLSKWLLTFR